MQLRTCVPLNVSEALQDFPPGHQTLNTIDHRPPLVHKIIQQTNSVKVTRVIFLGLLHPTKDFEFGHPSLGPARMGPYDLQRPNQLT
jgi:hypothetical protein